MGNSKILYGALGLCALGLTACSNDDLGMKGNVVENDEVRYLKVAIANPAATRADFEIGTDEENAVKALYFKFYDVAGQPVGTAQNNSITFEPNTGDPTPSVGQIANVVLQLDIKRGEQMPAYVVAFINPVNFSEINAEDNMQDLRNQVRKDYKSPAGAFAMNNSVYYGNDPVSGAQNVKMFGAPILADQLYTSQAAAAAGSAKAVEIYVERYAAKVKFTLADNAVKAQSVGDYSLVFEPAAWSVNADAAEMYASKRFENSNASTDAIPTFAEVQATLGAWTTWNDAPNHRSYWACSPGFYANVFPQVSDDIIDKAAADPEVAGSQNGAGILVGDYALRYYSYNQITDANLESDGLGVTVFNNGGNNWKYVLENTMGARAFASANPKAAAPSVVLVGSYKVSKDGTEINHAAGFCIYNDNVYFRNEAPAGVNGAQRIKDVLMNQNQIIATTQTGTMLNADVSQDVRDCFEVTHPTKDVRNGLPVPHRYVTLQLKEDLTTEQLSNANLYFKPLGSDTWRRITVNDITAINQQLWAQLGNARNYEQNKAYFSIPIQHLGITENAVADSPITDGVIDWKKVRVGDFGLVRNHVYDLQVSEINGVASGIDNLNNPLVPSMDENQYYIKYQLNILNWRVVPTQDNIILK